MRDPFHGYDQWKTASPFDEGEPYYDDYDEELEGLQIELMQHSTGRCGQDEVCCLTGKDADLEPWGEQWITLDSADEEQAHCTFRAYVSVAGTDVCLNLPEKTTEEEYEKAQNEYLEQATEIVCGANLAGEWDGDSWILGTQESFDVNWHYLKDDTPDYPKTVEEIMKALTPVQNRWEEEVIPMNDYLNEAAGWKKEVAA